MKVISEIKAQYPSSTGELIYIKINLDDLDSVKSAAEEFLSKETRLDVLWNNAAVMMPPAGSMTKQGWELQFGVNALAPFLLTKLLTPIMVQTAKTSVPGSVRVVWVSSSAAYLFAPTGGVEIARLENQAEKDPLQMYSVSKAANALYSLQFARMYKKDGIVSVVGGPALRSALSITNHLRPERKPGKLEL